MCFLKRKRTCAFKKDLTPLAWRYSADVLKYTAEIVNVGKAAKRGGFANRKASGFKQAFCVCDFFINQIFVWSCVKVIFEKVTKASLRNSDCLHHSAKAFLLTKMYIHISLCR